MRHAPAAQADLGARLGPGLDLDLLLALDRRDGDPGAERGLGDRDLGVVGQLRPLAAQRRMRRDMDRDVETAGCATARADLALVGQADLVALVDARPGW